MSESLGVKPPLPIAFPFEEFDALVNHCKDEHPTGWGELRVSVLQSIRMA